MQVGQYVTVNGEVVSHLNISGVLTNDGGQYACVASSTVGSVKHAARLNVYGLPYIRWEDWNLRYMNRELIYIKIKSDLT